MSPPPAACSITDLHMQITLCALIPLDLKFGCGWLAQLLIPWCWWIWRYGLGLHGNQETLIQLSGHKLHLWPCPVIPLMYILSYTKGQSVSVCVLLPQKRATQSTCFMFKKATNDHWGPGNPPCIITISNQDPGYKSLHSLSPKHCLILRQNKCNLDENHNDQRAREGHVLPPSCPQKTAQSGQKSGIWTA